MAAANLLAMPLTPTKTANKSPTLILLMKVLSMAACYLIKQLKQALVLVTLSQRKVVKLRCKIFLNRRRNQPCCLIFLVVDRLPTPAKALKK